MALQNLIIAVGGLFVQWVVNQNGVLFVAGYTATNKLYGLLELAAVSFGFAVSTFAGQNLGAGQIRRIRKGVRTAAWLGVGVAVAVASFVGVTVGSLEGAGVSVGVFSSPLSFLSSLSWLLLAVSSLSRKCETPK